MRKLFFLSLIVILLRPAIGQAQALKDSLPYFSGSGEIILAFSDINQGTVSSIPRFSLFLHFQEQINWNLSRRIGFYSGLALRNIGLIYKLEDPMVGREIKYKQRAYTLGLPLAIKIGNMNKRTFVFAGGEIEWAFAYKQKTFDSGHKDVYTEWFGNQVHQFLPSVFAGLQLTKGTNIKFKYYLSDFLNQGYSRLDNGQYIKPFAGLSTHVFYVSISTFISGRKKRADWQKQKEKEKDLLQAAAFPSNSIH